MHVRNNPSPARDQALHRPFARHRSGVTAATISNERDHLGRTCEVPIEGIWERSLCAAACIAAGPEIEQLMIRYQQADLPTPAAFVGWLNPQLSRFFARPEPIRATGPQGVAK